MECEPWGGRALPGPVSLDPTLIRAWTQHTLTRVTDLPCPVGHPTPVVRGGWCCLPVEVRGPRDELLVAASRLHRTKAGQGLAPGFWPLTSLHRATASTASSVLPQWVLSDFPPIPRSQGQVTRPPPPSCSHSSPSEVSAVPTSLPNAVPHHSHPGAPAGGPGSLQHWASVLLIGLWIAGSHLNPLPNELLSVPAETQFADGQNEMLGLPDAKGFFSPLFGSHGHVLTSLLMNCFNFSWLVFVNSLGRWETLWEKGFLILKITRKPPKLDQIQSSLCT